MPDFWKRTITALIFAAVVITCFVLGTYYLAVLSIIIAGFVYWEYTSLVRKESYKRISIWKILIVLVALLYFASTHVIFHHEPQDLYAPELNLLGIHFVGSIGFLIFLILGHALTKDIRWMRSAILDFIGFVLIIITLSLLNIVAHQVDFNYVYYVPLSMLFFIWVNDVFAYLIGSKFGKHPLAKSISPKKSIEGAVGGFVFCIIAAIIFSKIWPDVSLITWIAMAVTSSVFGVIGDLLESKLKRFAGAKDSANFLPGHGGFLDRFDAFLFSIPFVCLVFWIFN